MALEEQERPALILKMNRNKLLLPFLSVIQVIDWFSEEKNDSTSCSGFNGHQSVDFHS